MVGRKVFSGRPESNFTPSIDHKENNLVENWGKKLERGSINSNEYYPCEYRIILKNLR